MDNIVNQLSQIVPAERILLLPHCLRRSSICNAKYDRQGLHCQECDPDCPINRLQAAAREHGYKGVCVAPGGRLAVSFVQEKQPRAIVAIACEKELEEGVQGVKELEKNDISPLMVIIPLLKDGCVDTEVDVEGALEIINAGCMEPVRK